MFSAYCAQPIVQTSLHRVQTQKGGGLFQFGKVPKRPDALRSGPFLLEFVSNFNEKNVLACSDESRGPTSKERLLFARRIT